MMGWGSIISALPRARWSERNKFHFWYERDLTFSETGDKVEVERMPRVVVEDVRELGTNIIGKT